MGGDQPLWLTVLYTVLCGESTCLAVILSFVCLFVIFLKKEVDMKIGTR